MSSTEQTEFETAVAAQHALLAEAFAKGDASIISDQLFLPEAWSVGAGDVTVKGSKAVGELFAPFVGAFRWSSRSVSLVRNGDSGWDFCGASMEAIDGSATHHFKILFVWKKVGGAWRIAAQMYVDGGF